MFVFFTPILEGKKYESDEIEQSEDYGFVG